MCSCTCATKWSSENPLAADDDDDDEPDSYVRFSVKKRNENKLIIRDLYFSVSDNRRFCRLEHLNKTDLIYGRKRVWFCRAGICEHAIGNSKSLNNRLKVVFVCCRTWLNVYTHIHTDIVICIILGLTTVQIFGCMSSVQLCLSTGQIDALRLMTSSLNN